MATRDIDIRRALRREIERRHRGEPDTLIVEELGLCQGVARVDVAVINGNVHGYEIKSEHDTLARLPGQTGIYNRTLDYVTVVTAPTHSGEIANVVPAWWGIWTAVQCGDQLRLQSERTPRHNPNVNPFALAQLLWREESLRALADRGLAEGMWSKPRKELWSRLALKLTVEELGEVVRECLKRRGADWRVPVSPS